MSVNYKSEDGLSDLESCAYFWNERNDPSRFVGWGKCIAKAPELKFIWGKYKDAISIAKIEFEEAFQKIVDEHDPKEWGN